jgi:hypothetical protein
MAVFPLKAHGWHPHLAGGIGFTDAADSVELSPRIPGFCVHFSLTLGVDDASHSASVSWTRA